VNWASLMKLLVCDLQWVTVEEFAHLSIPQIEMLLELWEQETEGPVPTTEAGLRKMIRQHHRERANGG
jgi:uncharacterized protein Usg